MTDELVNSVNKVVAQYFAQNTSVSMVPAKDLMPLFIKAGVFPSNHRDGLPIRKLLRELDKAKQLHQIPYVHAVRKKANTNWFFIRSKQGNVVSIQKPGQTKRVISVVRTATSRANSDEHYILDLCDKVLGLKGSRQHRFDFLLGDAGATGRRAKLPVDSFYPTLNMVIEFCEVQHVKPVKHFDKPNKMTVSGVHRGEQRKKYDALKRSVLPKNGIKVLDIFYNEFEVDGRDRLIRNLESDLKIVKSKLTKYAMSS